MKLPTRSNCRARRSVTFAIASVTDPEQEWLKDKRPAATNIAGGSEFIGGGSDHDGSALVNHLHRPPRRYSTELANIKVLRALRKTRGQLDSFWTASLYALHSGAAWGGVAQLVRAVES